MNLTSIKDSIVSILNADSGLSTFGLKQVFEGYRDNISKDNHPCVMIELLDNDESEKEDMNGSVTNVATFAIGCYVQVYDLDDQLDQILNFEKLVKKALSQDYTIGGTALDRMFLKTLYDTQFWPIRGAVIPFQVKYRQSLTERT